MSDLRICLINPPSRFLINRVVFPPLGLLTLSAYFKQNGYTNIQFIDMVNDTNIDNVKADIFFIYVATPNYESAKEVMVTLRKKHNLTSKFVVGGPHVSVAPETCMWADAVVIGEGEVASLQILKNFPNLKKIYHEDKILNLDDIPFPDRDILDIRMYADNYKLRGIPTTTLITSRGCSWGKCAFCCKYWTQSELPPDKSGWLPPTIPKDLVAQHMSEQERNVVGNSNNDVNTYIDIAMQGGTIHPPDKSGGILYPSTPHYNHIRYRSAENIVEEIKQIKEKYKIKGIMFFDDEFVHNKKRLKEFCKLVKPLNVHWRCLSRVESIDSTIVPMMRKAGCIEIAVGIESADQEILNNINKHIDIKKAEEACNIITDNGIDLKELFIIGLPGESPGSLRKIDEFVERTKPYDVDFTVLSVFPGSDIYEHPEKYDITFNKNCKAHYKGRPGEYGTVCPISTSKITFKELVHARDTLEKKYKPLEKIMRKS